MQVRADNLPLHRRHSEGAKYFYLAIVLVLLVYFLPDLIIEPNKVLIALLGAALLTAFLSRRLFMGLLLLIMLLPLQTSVVVFYNVTIFKLYFVFFFLAALLHQVMRKQLYVDWPFFLLLFACLLAAVASTMKAISFDRSVFYTVLYFYRTAIIFLIPWVVTQRDQLYKIKDVFIVVAFLSAGTAILELFGFFGQDFYRVSGIFAEANQLGNFCNYVLPLILASFLIDRSKKWNLFLIIAALTLSFAILSTNSRSNWFVFMVVLIPFAFLFSKKPRLIPVILFVAIFFVLGYYFHPQRELIDIRYREVVEVGLESGYRLQRLQFAWNLFKENLILGVGIAHYGNYLLSAHSFIEGTSTHNIFLQVLAETGLVGFVFFAGLHVYIFVIFIRAIKNAKRTSDKILYFAFLWSFVAWLADAQFHGFTPFAILQNVSIGLALALKRITGNED